MTDLEIIGALGAGCAGLGGAARWLLGFWREVKKADREAAGERAKADREAAERAAEVLAEAQRETRDALIANTASNTLVCERLEVFGERLEDVQEFVRKHVTLAPQNKRAETLGRGSRAKTPPTGVRSLRSGSQHDEEG
jgi:DNA repair exonuclease SbcCD ATPase subunit